MTDIEKELYKVMEILIKFPNSTVCKHYAVLHIIEAMQNSGLIIDEKLIESIFNDSADDKQTLNLIRAKL